MNIGLNLDVTLGKFEFNLCKTKVMTLTVRICENGIVSGVYNESAIFVQGMAPTHVQDLLAGATSMSRSYLLVPQVCPGLSCWCHKYVHALLAGATSSWYLIVDLVHDFLWGTENKNFFFGMMTFN